MIGQSLQSLRLSHRKGSRSDVQPSSGSARPLAAVSLRNGIFLLIVLASVVVFWAPLRTLVDYSMRGEYQYDQYSIAIMIPFLSIALAYSERKRIFAKVQYSLGVGAILLFIAFALDGISQEGVATLGHETSLSMAILGLVLLWIGGFLLCYGRQAFRAGAFALMFLLLTVPLPSSLFNGPVSFVREGSADVASLIFHIFGVPVFRNGFTFALPQLTIEVAKECSGINSMLALFIVSLLASHFFQLSNWKKVVMALLVFPIVCVTNGLRIATITLLSAYVAPWVIHSSLHRKGGSLFFVLGLVLLMTSLQLIRKVNIPVRAGSGGGR